MVTCYLDESGTDNLSPTAVVGGLIMNEPSFFWFDVEWSEMLKEHKVPPPLHMKKIPPGTNRTALFVDAVRLINRHKGASIAATLSTEQFDKHFAVLFKNRRVVGVYEMCFLLVVIMNNKLAEVQNYKGNIPFLMDTGNEYKHHVVDMHRFTVNSEERYNLGNLDFATDDLNALQAADVIAWSARRNLTKGLTGEFEPLSGIFDDRHWSHPVSDSDMAEIASKLHGKI